MTELIEKYFTDLTPVQLHQLQLLGPVYKEWNEKINVISRKDVDALYLHHVLHSLGIAAITGFEAGTKVIDIGCGGGFPGVPLAIFFPDTQFHLVDSIAKKLKVVSAVCEAAGIANITVQHTRVEEIKNRKFDFAVSRAVAPLRDLWRWSAPLLQRKPAKIQAEDSSLQQVANGLICLKGGDLTLEIYESGVKPSMMDLYSIFKEDYFKDKFILHVAK